MDQTPFKFLTIRGTLTDFFDKNPMGMKIEHIQLLQKTNSIFQADSVETASAPEVKAEARLK
jgi:hypothetical protein